MLKKGKLVFVAIAMIACLVIATFLFTLNVSSQPGQPNEPASLADIVEFPYLATSTQTCSDSLTDPLFNALMAITYANKVEGIANIMNELSAEGANMAAWPSYFGRIDDQTVNVTGTINGVGFGGNASGGWTSTFAGPAGSGSVGANQRALLVMALMNDSTSIIISAVTNLNPPDQISPGYHTANAMQYVYVNFTFWAYRFHGDPNAEEVSWYYLQYSSNYNPNWFWGVYLWWRTYLRSYGLPYYAWYWWFWHWYYWKFWYSWGTSFPYS